MNKSFSQRLVLGIDGGGTKAVAELADADSGRDERLGQGRGGPANPRAVGFAQAIQNLNLAIDLAFEDAGIPRSKVAAACLALAGAGRATEQARIQQWARETNLADHVKLAHDAEPILVDGTTDGLGVALISGTGSLAYGKNEQGETDRVGGWGYVFGDEGSGYSLAVAALRAAAHAADGRGPPTQLLPLLLKKLQVTAPMGLIEAIYGSDMDRRAISQLAPVVCQAAQEGDAVADTLLDATARDLALMVAALRSKLRLDSASLPLAIAGSLLLQGESLKERLQEHLVRSHTIAPFVGLVPQPVRGAVTMARQMVTAL